MLMMLYDTFSFHLHNNYSIMRLLLFFSCCFFSSAIFAQLNTHIFWTEQTALPASQVIYYRPEKALAWKDFQGSPVMNSRAVAITVSGFGYKADIKNKGNNGELNISVYCYFNKPTSWVKSEKPSQYILLHEQHHFDITYLAAKMFIEKLKAANFTAANMNQILPKIYTESCDIMNKLQDDYDGQTKNGQLKDVQQKWNAYIDDKLSLLIK